MIRYFQLRIMILTIFCFALCLIVNQPFISQADSLKTNSLSSEREAAIELNNRGFKLYKEGKYEEALDLFKKSFTSDNTYYLAHYNYACTIGILAKSDEEFGYDHYEEIYEHLQIVKKLNPAYIQKIKTDPDLDIIRKDFRYLVLIGLSPTKTDDVEEILTSLEWYIVGEGIYNCVGGAKFSKNKQLEFWFYDNKFFTSHDFNIPQLKYKGAYQVEGNKITVHLEKRMLRRREWTDFLNNDTKYEEKMVFSGILTKDGQLKFEIFNYPLLDSYPNFSA
jgi:tetratricopeptide (TPR) repeat protein